MDKRIELWINYLVFQGIDVRGHHLDDSNCTHSNSVLYAVNWLRGDACDRSYLRNIFETKTIKYNYYIWAHSAPYKSFEPMDFALGGDTL